MFDTEEPAPSSPLLAVRLLDALDGVPGRVLAGGCLLTILLVGMADYLTPQYLSFTIFYLLPVLVGGGRSLRFGLRMAVASASVWLIADLVRRTPAYPSLFAPLWNTSLRFLVLGLVVALIDALRRSLFYEHRLSRRDELTGLANFRGFYEVAESERRRLARTGRPLTLAYIDIDNFKGLNDRDGHAAGDEVIIATARLLAASLRDVDTIARIGGDEFALLLPETDSIEAELLLARLHHRLVEDAEAKELGIGYSGGAVTFATSGLSVEAMVAEADRVMYEVKHSGKNAIRFLAA
jgi:diguanylate cyclase (GGDEF)-like protein